MTWNDIETIPPNTLVWLYGNRQGKDIVGPVIGHYDEEDDFFYDENGLGHAWMTHWQEIQNWQEKPEPPEV